MELTNHSAIDIFGQFSATQPELARSRQRLGSGKRITRSSDDPGVTAIAMKKHAELSRNHAIQTGLQNAISYANMQHEGLNQVGEIYHRMGVLSQNSLDIMKNEHDRGLLQKEFDELVDRLIKIRDDKFNGVPLFDPLVRCGGTKDIPLGELNLVSGKPGGVSHAVRAQTVDVQARGGTLTFRVNSGVAADTYRVYMGNEEIFSAGSAFQGPDPTEPIYDDPPGFGFIQDGWRTSGWASNGDFDTIEVKFAPDQPTTYSITLGASNVGLYPLQDQLTTAGGVIRTNALSPGSTSTMLTLQVETRTIGMIYDDVIFEPSDVSNDQVVLTDVNGETMTIDSLGFGTMLGYGVKSVAEAQATLEQLYGKTGDGTREGEVHCLLTNNQSKTAAHISRLNSAIEKLRVSQVSEERVLNTIEGVDFAMETTRLARHNVKMETLNRLLSTATRMTDVLIPLAAQRPGGA